MTKALRIAIALGFLLPVSSGAADSLSIVAQPGRNAFTLEGPDSAQQLLVLGDSDLTREASWNISPEGIVSVDSNGLVTPLADGKATIAARLDGGGETGALTVTVTGVKVPRPISFPNDIVPIFTRNHCNAGTCHAKAGGQNGFTLSLFGYDPEADYETLVKAARGRRVMAAAPENSILLLKVSGTLPHGGGLRMDTETEDYRMLRRWVAEGAPYGPDDDPTVERIEIYPKSRVVQPGSHQQLTVTAHFSDGSIRDITRAAQFEPNHEEMAEVDAMGLVSFADKGGSTSVLARFQEHVDVFQATLPLGHPVGDLPPARNLVDEEIFEKLGLLGLPPSPESDDATFLRRATIDIAGRIPTLEETRAFLESTGPEKRARKIDDLLDNVDYADHFAGKWSGLLRNKAQGGLDWVSRDTYAFHGWIRAALIANRPFDELAAELITASGKTGENPAASWYRSVTDPKERMQDVAQVFLGIRMQCAQCHHHPYERWSQDDYYGFAAFFSTIERKEVYRLPEDDIVFHNRKAAQFLNPASGETLKPAVPGGEPLEIAPEEDPRRELARWIRDPENPWFARVLVNRYWKHFLGRGLVEPEDDIRPTNPATHPELLDRLAASFVESGYDLKQLIRTICNSRTYQLAAEPNEFNGDDEQNYARYYPRRLQAEVLLDSFNDLTGAQNSFNKLPKGVRAIALPDDNANKDSEFLTMFGRPQMDSACECERTGEANLGQSLHLINADLIQQKLSTPGGTAETLAGESDRPDEERITELYLHALSRRPAPDELEIGLAHLRKKRSEAAEDAVPAAEKLAFEDILWVLANTKEFLFNH